MLSKRIFYTSSIILFILSIYSFSNFSLQKEETIVADKTKVGDKIPSFSFEATDGKTYSISDFEGKVVWLNFFATWCGPCIREIPHLKKLQEEYGDKLVVIGIGREHDINVCKSFEKKMRIDYILGADPDRSIFNLFADRSIPRNYVIDTKGIIKIQEKGYSPELFKILKDKLKKIMDEN